MINVPFEIETIINVANELATTQRTRGSNNERIAAAFVLDRMEFLPHGYCEADAWAQLEDWQALVNLIKSHYSDLLVPW